MVLIILLFFFRWGSAYFVSQKTENTLVSKVLVSCFVVMFSKRSDSQCVAALLIRISNFPKVEMVVSMTFSQWDSLLKSPFIRMHFLPDFSTSFLVSFASLVSLR